MKEEFRILSTTAILGYGFPKESFEEGMKRKPDLIAVDAGSTDPGPFYRPRRCQAGPGDYDYHRH